jgi:putative sigma-54 modulation protein
MQYIFQSPNIKVSAKANQAIQKKFERFEKLYDRIEQCHVVLKTEKDGKQENCIVEARLVVPGNDLFARERARSFELAAENACLDLESQIKKRKAKLNKKTDHHSIDQYIDNEELE